MNISFEQANAFCHVVEQGGYTKAAEKLHKSHSSLIYLISNFEEQCQVQLFDRSTYRNKLTPTGKLIYGKCLEILAQVNELEQLCSQMHAGWEASLKIVFDGSLPYESFYKLYKRFKAEKINTVVQTYSHFLEDVELAYLTLNADFMISLLPAKNQKLSAVFLKTQKSRLVAHRDHPLHKNSQRWTLNELKKFDFLTIRGSGGSLGLPTRELEDSASFYLSDFSVKKEAIMKSFGFGWLPQHLIEKELQNKTLIPIKWERPNVVNFQPILYYDSRKVTGPAGKIILDFLKSDSFKN